MVNNASNTPKKRLFINIIAQLTAFAVNIGIGFFLTPYIIETVGSTSYGFVGLANNFVSYIQILVIALNSMAGRFIAISYYKEDYESVQKYYSSVLFSNVLISLALTVPCTLLLVFMDRVVDVPAAILPDIRILWAPIFGSMMVSIVGGIFNNAAYVHNRLELVSLRSIESHGLRALILVGSFSLLAPKVWYVGLASLLSGVYVVIVNMFYTKKLMPMVKIRRKHFDFAKIKELVASGIWNSIAQLGNVLFTGLDLLITNLFVGAESMGVVAISKTVPTYISSLFITVSSVFAPQLTISFAQEDKKGMIHQLLFAMKLMAMFASIPVSFLLVFGQSFYRLWVPSQNSALLLTLTVIAVINYPICLLAQPLENVFSTLNKVKTLSLITLGIAFSSCLSVLLLLQLTADATVKMLIVVGVSAVFGLLRSGVVVPLYCSRLLDIPVSKFFPTVLKSLLSTGVISLLLYGVSLLYTVASWAALVIAGAGTCLLGLALNYLFILSQEEKQSFRDILLKKLRK